MIKTKSITLIVNTVLLKKIDKKKLGVIHRPTHIETFSCHLLFIFSFQKDTLLLQLAASLSATQRVMLREGQKKKYKENCALEQSREIVYKLIPWVSK